ncbi:MAG: COX15/CtaA family protein [Anaerolineales bacterium]
MVPLEPAVETLIEFSHRLTSGLAFIGVVGMVILARKAYADNHPVRRLAFLSLVFIIVESLIGAGLVLFELVGSNASMTRAGVVSLHLLNTLILLSFLALTWWRSRFLGAEEEVIGYRFAPIAGWGIFALAVLLIGVSGAIAALGNTLFPSQSLVEGIQRDFDRTSHFLIRLRVYHPLFAVLGAFAVLNLIYRAFENDSRPLVRRIGWLVVGLGISQIVAGFITLILLAPVWMQLIHLFVADLLWITFVIFVDSKRYTYIKA